MKKTLLMMAVVGLLASTVAAQDWKLGVQAYSFRQFTLCDTLDAISQMGVKYLEGYSKQTIGGGIEGKTDYHMDAATRDAVLAKLQAAGVKMVSYGVITGKNEADWRAIFDFAKAMGIETIISEPKTEELDLLVKLCAEYQIDIAIHNHAKPTAYWDPQTTLDATTGRPGIYGSPDNGHWARSGIKSVDGFKTLEGHMKSIHLKDMEVFGDVDAKECVPLGEGVCDIPAVFAELKRQNYQGMFIFEYESEPENPGPSVKKCVDYFNAHANCPAADAPVCCPVVVAETDQPAAAPAAPKQQKAEKKKGGAKAKQLIEPAQPAPAKQTIEPAQPAKVIPGDDWKTLEQYQEGAAKWCRINNKPFDKAKATQSFFRLDTNHDGYVTPEEKTGLSIEPVQPVRVIPDADWKTVEQYQEGAAKWCRINNKPFDKAKATKTFFRLDTNHDGYVTPEEKDAGLYMGKKNK
jgi:sugar phosphate isomerase/epimerase